MDILTALGAGQRICEPHPYGHALHRVFGRILAEPDVELQLELGADDVCQPCTHNKDGLCQDTIDTSFRPAAPTSKRQWNLLIDRRWCRRLGLDQDSKLTARQLARRLRDRAGDITDIYREIPAERTAERAAKLQEGIHQFLGEPTADG